MIFCTGGIRCEKAAPWMIQRGFKNVYQLEGGILKYLEALNTKSTEQKVADIEIKLQIIFEELQRQNEILTMIHRRSTLAANFSLHSLNELKKSSSFSDKEKQELISHTEKEIKQSGIQLLRK